MTELKTPPAEPETAAQPHTNPLAWPLGLAGVALVIVGSFLSWSYDSTILGDLSINFYPGGLQILTIIMALFALVLLLVEKGPLTRLGAWLDATAGLRALGVTLTLYMLLVLIAISVESDGLINVNPGGYITLVGAVLILVSSRMLPLRQLRDMSEAKLPAWVEILAIAVLMGSVLFVAAYALGLDDAWSFILCLVFVAAMAVALFRTGALTWVGHVSQRQRKVLTLSAFMVAFLFPFTQGGSDANMSIATQVLVFAATAMGLNIVVGLAGLHLGSLGNGSSQPLRLKGRIRPPGGAGEPPRSESGITGRDTEGHDEVRAVDG